MEFSGLFCRCCLKSSQDIGLVSIFDVYYEDIRMDKILHSISQLDVRQNDQFSIMICEECTEKGSTAYEFKQLCIASEQTLMNNIVEQSEDPTEYPFSPRKRNSSYNESVLRATEFIEIDDDEDYIDENQLIEEMTFEDEEIHEQDFVVNHFPSKKNKFTCSDCGLICRDALDLINHLKEHKDFMDSSSSEPRTPKHPQRPKRFPCPECNKFFESPSKVGRHMNYHTKERERLQKYGADFMSKRKNRPKNYPCDFCEKMWETPSKVIRHISQVHMKQEGGIKSEISAGTSTPGITIIESPAIETSYVNYQVPIKPKYSVPKKHICEICWKTCDGPSKLERHMKVHKKEKDRLMNVDQKVQKVKKKNHECPFCTKKWESPSKMNRHIRQVHEPKQQIKPESLENDILEVITTTLQQEVSELAEQTDRIEESDCIEMEQPSDPVEEIIAV